MRCFVLILLLFSMEFHAASQAKLVPPGTLQIADNLFVDKSEMANINWLEFLYYMEQDLESDDYRKLLPDSINTWFREPDERWQPVNYLSLEQAEAYCAWRSKVVSEKLGQKVIYRIPTLEEWKLVFDYYLDRMTPGELEKEEKQLKKNLKELEGTPLLFPIDKEASELQNLFDNVSEMTSDKGLAIGGNNAFFMPFGQQATHLFQYEKPGFYLGFRCVASFE